LATIGRRTGAAFIDSLVVTLFVLILFYDPLMVLADLTRVAVTPEKQAEFMVAFQAFQAQTLPYIFALYVVYHAILVWQGGMTLGKYMMKIKVVQADGTAPVSFGAATARALGRTIGEMFVFYVTFLPAWFTPLRQTLHDRIAKTVVIDLRAAS
jgi:uncharacterized RDD family membrane protein YckC